LPRSPLIVFGNRAIITIIVRAPKRAYREQSERGRKEDGKKLNKKIARMTSSINNLQIDDDVCREWHEDALNVAHTDEDFFILSPLTHSRSSSMQNCFCEGEEELIRRAQN
jgi:hypothetical protein